MWASNLGNDRDQTSASVWWMGGNLVFLKSRIAAKADLNLRNNRGWISSFTASTYGNIECLKLLIGGGSNVNLAIHLRLTPPFITSARGNVGCLKLLIEAGADINITTYFGLTPICTASRYGNEDCLKLLIAARADMNIPTLLSFTPFKAAMKYGEEGCLKLLAEYRAPTRKDSYIQNESPSTHSVSFEGAVQWCHSGCQRSGLYENSYNRPPIKLHSVNSENIVQLSHEGYKKVIIAPGRQVYRGKINMICHDCGVKFPLLRAQIRINECRGECVPSCKKIHIVSRTSNYCDDELPTFLEGEDP